MPNPFNNANNGGLNNIQSLMNNPMFKMLKNKGMNYEQMVRFMCQQKGINFEEFINQVKQMKG